MSPKPDQVVDKAWTERQLRDHLHRVLSPGVCSQLLSALRRDNPDFAHVAHIVQGDPFIAAKMIAMANLIGGRKGEVVVSLDRAVQLLGMRNVRMLALSVMLAGPLIEPDAKVQHRRDLWRWAIACGVAGDWIGRVVMAGGADNDDAEAEYLVGGLVLGLGALVMYVGLGRPYARLLGLPIRPIDLATREIERFGASHHQVTVWVLESIRSPRQVGAYAAALVAGDDERTTWAGHAIELLGARVAGYQSDPAMLGLLDAFGRLGADATQLFGDQLRTLRRRSRELADAFGVDISDEQRPAARRQFAAVASRALDGMITENLEQTPPASS